MIKSRRMRWAEHVARMDAIRIPKVTLKSESKRSLGSLRYRQDYNIKTDTKILKFSDMNWILFGSE